MGKQMPNQKWLIPMHNKPISFISMENALKCAGIKATGESVEEQTEAGQKTQH
jgi:hypothetical protein